MRVIGNGRIRRTGAGISYGSGATIKQLQDWELATDDDAATVETAGYFNALAALMKIGEKIIARLDLDGTPAFREYIVSANTGTVVTITRENVTAGAGLQTLAFFVNLADIAAAGDVLTNYVPGYAFKIEKFDFRVSKPATTAAKLASLNMEIGTVDLTGGVIALTSANCTPAGAAVAGTAITAANVGTALSSFSVEASAVTAFVEGSGWLIVQIRNLEG
ncbi:hypothetical protein [Mesorhizobium sp. M1399]|uniref:hypothetical protein n=1 Tax=Mesorhizobium sp. M1399 TaxID=2957096 RepID=UPI0033357A74